MRFRAGRAYIMATSVQLITQEPKVTDMLFQKHISHVISFNISPLR